MTLRTQIFQLSFFIGVRVDILSESKTIRTFPTPGNCSPFGCGRGMTRFTSAPANHINNSKCLTFIKIYKENFQVNMDGRFWRLLSVYVRPDSLKQNVGLQKSCKTKRYDTEKINTHARTFVGENDNP
jgi:hypothetical protein